MAPLPLLTFSTLYPNDQRPNHGIFVENRLRHLVADRIRSGTLPDGSVLVVRALPAAAGADSVLLGRDLDSALRKLLGRDRP